MHAIAAVPWVSFTSHEGMAAPELGTRTLSVTHETYAHVATPRAHASMSTNVNIPIYMPTCMYEYMCVCSAGQLGQVLLLVQP